MAGPLGEVLPDGESGDVVPRVLCRYIACGATDDDDQFGFPVDGVGGQLQVADRAGQRGAELGEDGRFGGEVQSGFDGVVSIVEADREDLRGLGHRRTQVGVVV